MANNNSNLIEKLLGGSGLNQVWVKVFSLVKILTGDVDVKNKGNLQKQIDDVRSSVENMGKNQARVFQTVDELDTWLEEPSNVAQLTAGDNFYIVATDVPDYWWDGTQKQPLEGQKVDLSTYDQEINKLNEDITDHKSSADHDSRYYTKAQNKLIKCKDVQIKATQDRSATLKIDTYGGFAIPILADPGSRAWEIYVGLQYATDTLVLSGEGIAAGYTYTVRIFYFQ